jgi:hypothetical protein
LPATLPCWGDHGPQSFLTSHRFVPGGALALYFQHVQSLMRAHIAQHVTALEAS